jgi:hypothetical protein
LVSKTRRAVTKPIIIFTQAESDDAATLDGPLNPNDADVTIDAEAIASESSDLITF